MAWFRPRDRFDRVFAVGIILKGLDGVLELLGGLLLLFATPATINQIVAALTQHELSEDPGDLIATHLQRAVHELTGSAVLFAAAYLLSHGVVKTVLAVALLRNKLWAYPWMLAFLAIFIVYQIYRMTFAATLWLAGLTVFDAAVAWLTYREYRKRVTA